MLPAGLSRGFVLTGGQSSRMGRDKALLELRGRPMVLYVAESVVRATLSVTLVGSKERYASLGLPVVEDLVPGQGPLSGIHAALKESRTPLNLIVGCDMPFLDPAFLEHLLMVAAASDAEVTLPETLDSGVAALCAVYHRDALPPVEQALQEGERKLSRVHERLRVRRLGPEEWEKFNTCGLLFQNVNTPEEFEQTRRSLEAPAYGEPQEELQKQT